MRSESVLLERTEFISPSDASREGSDKMQFVEVRKYEQKPVYVSAPGWIPKLHFLRMSSSEGDVDFRKPLTAHIRRENDQIVFHNIELDVFGSGSSPEEAIQDFMDFLIHDYLSYTQCSVDDLAPEAIKLRELYLEKVKSYVGNSQRHD